jgi:hypothetical protein
MARRGREVYVPADPSKLGLRPFHPWARLALPWTLVTDDGADPDQVESFRDAGGCCCGGHRRWLSPPKRLTPSRPAQAPLSPD